VGAPPRILRRGPAPTLEAIKRLGAAYSYEESGKYYFPRTFLWPDGVYSPAGCWS
jgi:hypothetical protein